MGVLTVMANNRLHNQITSNYFCLIIIMLKKLPISLQARNGFILTPRKNFVLVTCDVYYTIIILSVRYDKSYVLLDNAKKLGKRASCWSYPYRNCIVLTTVEYLHT